MKIYEGKKISGQENMKFKTKSTWKYYFLHLSIHFVSFVVGNRSVMHISTPSSYQPEAKMISKIEKTFENLITESLAFVKLNF